MSYRAQLSPWVIYRRLPSFQRLFIERFRSRNHAEDYLKVLQQLLPHAQFEIVFEVAQKQQEQLDSQIIEEAIIANNFVNDDVDHATQEVTKQREQVGE